MPDSIRPRPYADIYMNNANIWSERTYTTTELTGEVTITIDRRTLEALDELWVDYKIWDTIYKADMWNIIPVLFWMLIGAVMVGWIVWLYIDYLTQ